MDWLEHLATLDLAPGASREDVKLAWRDLVKIWHPDRFAGEPRIQQRCHEKLKQINHAYEQLERAFDAGVQPADPEIPRVDIQVDRCQSCRRPVSTGTLLCPECLAIFSARVAQQQRRISLWNLLAPVLAGAILLGSLLLINEGVPRQYRWMVLVTGLVCFALLMVVRLVRVLMQP